MDQPLEQCQNCLKMFPQSKVPTHFGYCRRNIKKCPKCGEMYDINFQEDHQEQFHKTSPCPHCKTQFPSSTLNKHVASCPKKPKFCEHCQQQIPITQFATHLRACQSRTKPCQKCKKAISNKEYFLHLAECNGIVPQPKSKNYNEHIEDQRSKMKKEQPKKEYHYANPPQRGKREEYVYEKKEQPKGDIRKESKVQPSKYMPKKPFEKHEEKPRNPPSRAVNFKYPEPKNVQPQKVSLKESKAPEKKKNWEQEYMNDIQFDAQHQLGFDHFEHPKNPPQNHHIQPPRNDFYPEENIPNFQEHNGIQHEMGELAISEDPQLQKAIMESMGKKPVSKSSLPKQLQGEEMMNQSFYRDAAEIEKQKALFQQFQKKGKR